MRTFLLFVCSILYWFHFSYAAASQSASFDSSVYPLGLNRIKLSTLLKVNVKETEMLSRQRMNLKEKIAFAIGKNRMKNEVEKNSDVTFGEYIESMKKLSAGKIILLVLGAYLLVIVILLLVDPPFSFW